VARPSADLLAGRLLAGGDLLAGRLAALPAPAGERLRLGGAEAVDSGLRLLPPGRAGEHDGRLLPGRALGGDRLLRRPLLARRPLM
jgi:hypothetical protein